LWLERKGGRGKWRREGKTLSRPEGIKEWGKGRSKEAKTQVAQFMRCGYLIEGVRGLGGNGNNVGPYLICGGERLGKDSSTSLWDRISDDKPR